MITYVEEPVKRTPVLNEYDIVIIGGGIAGVSAALAAAKNQAESVLLIDKQFGLGGLATLGLITIYLPICDGNGHQVCFGISEKLLRLSIKHGYEKAYPKAWLEDGTLEEKIKHRYCVQYNGNIFSLLMERELLKYSVDLLYGTYVCDVIVNEDRITGVVIENKSGRSVIKAKKVIDTSGDADVFVYTKTETQLYSRKTPLAAWYYSLVDGSIRLNQLGAADSVKDFSESSYNGGPDKLSELHFNGADAKELTDLVLESHKVLLDNFLRYGGITDDHSLTTMASIPQVRMTRKIVGETILDDTPFVRHDDSIGMTGDWRKRGPIFEIPFSCLYNGKMKNLITAGRSISTTDSMWDVTRVIPGCTVTGEAAGTAAAMTDDFTAIDIKELQARLIRNGVKLHISDIL